MHDAGLCTFKRDSDNVPYIEIAIREDSLNEDVVSHELLHAFYIKKGFGRSSYNTIRACNKFCVFSFFWQSIGI